MPGASVVIIVHDFQEVEVVVVVKLQVGLGRALGRGVLVPEVIPDGKRRPVHRFAAQSRRTLSALFIIILPEINSPPKNS